MSTRARQAAQRAAAIQAEQAAKQRRRNLVRATVAGTLLLVVAGALGLTLVLDRGPEASAVGDEQAALLTTPPPWPPQARGLPQRLAALDFPPVGDESYHAHVLLSVFRDGEPVEVPANIGFDRQGSHSSLHTHTPDGVIHMEADDPYPYELSQVFQVWGVAFGADRLGGDVATGEKKVHVYVNGKAASGPVVLKDGDNVVVAYGTDGSFPTLPPDDALDAA